MEKWDVRYRALIEYVEREGLIPSARRDQRMGSWVAEQKRRLRKGIMPTEQRELLEAIDGWYWDNEDLHARAGYSSLWKRNYDNLLTYMAENSRYPSQLNADRSISKLGSWVSRQRQTYRGDKKSRPLTARQIEMLERLPQWNWG